MRNTEVERGCLVPLAQCAVTGVLVGLATLAVGLYRDWEGPGYVALGAGAVGAAWWWLTSIHFWRRSVYMDLAALFRPREQAEAQPFRIEVDHGGGKMQFADLPATRDQLGKLGRGLTTGASFSEASWTGKGRPFTRGQFRALRDVFVRRGWAEWVRQEAPSQGVQLTATGKAVARHLARLEPEPPYPGGRRMGG
jgi:hypothetical protein